MAAAETARLIASLELQDKNFTRGIRNVERGVNRVDKKLGAFSGFVNRNVGRALDSIALRATQAIGSGLEDLATLEDATTSVTGAIAQVGKGWEVTGEQIATWANEIEADTEAAFDDKAIVASAATLIRYGKVSEDNLRPALEVMTDLAAKTGDTESAASLLAKALADPAKAAGKLQRQGVILTKGQQKQIKAMVKAGKTAEAQALLLEILADTTEGAAKASAGPYRDALNKLGDAGEDLRKSFAVGLLPVIEEVSNLLTTELAKKETLDTLKSIGSALADTLRSLISSARQLPWGAIGESLKIAGAGAKAVLDAFLGLPPWIQTAVLTGWGLNKLTGGALSGIVGSLASGLIKGVLGITAGVVHLKAATVIGGGGGIPGVAAPAAGAGGAAATAGTIASAVGVAAVPVVLIGGGAVSLQSIADFAGQNYLLQQRGLTEAEISAQRYYNGTQADQQTIIKHLGRQPTKADFESGNAKLARTLKGTSKAGAAKTTPAGAELSRLRRKGFLQAAGTVDLKPLLTKQQETTKKAQATENAVKNAKSINSRENSAQKTEITNAKNAAATAGRTTTTAVNANATATRGVSPPITGALAGGFASVVAALYATQTTVQSTNVVNNYTSSRLAGSRSGSRAAGTGGDI